MVYKVGQAINPGNKLFGSRYIYCGMNNERTFSLAMMYSGGPSIGFLNTFYPVNIATLLLGKVTFKIKRVSPAEIELEEVKG